MTVSNERPFQTLNDRLAGLPVDRALQDGVPEWLVLPIREWLNESLTNEIAKRVVLRLQQATTPSTSYKNMLVSANESELLNIVDATLQLHPGWDAPREDVWVTTEWTLDRFALMLVDLNRTLRDAGSLYRIDTDGRCLVRRVDETVQEAADATLKAAPATAADHLRAAWVAAYGLNPEPDKVFNEAIRAVEEVACPLVEQKKAAAGKATLGTVLGELRNAGHRWELVLPGADGQPCDVEPLKTMMETLWQAQRSRHGGGPNSRRQKSEEAEAALHLAVLLVQWLTAGVLRRKP